MLRNGFLLPSYKSSLCQIKWMQKVRSGHYWCPKTDTASLRNCPDPPRLDLIIEHLTNFAADSKLKTGITERRKPDRKWALLALATLKPDHAFFRKDFVPKKPVDSILADNSDGFFDSLPAGPHKKRFKGIMKENETSKLKRSLAHHELLMKKNQQRLEEL